MAEISAINIEYLRQDIFLAFEEGEAQGIREWRKWFDTFFRELHLDLCGQLLTEVNDLRRYPNLCKSCRARIRFAEGELCQKRAADAQTEDSRHDNQNRAKHCYEESLELLQQLISETEKDIRQNHMTKCEHDITDYQSLLLDIRKADMAKCYHQLGKLYFEQGQYQSAEQNYQRAIDLQTGSHLHEGLTLSLLGLGDVYRVTGQYHRAEEHVKKALEMAQEEEEHPNIADAYQHLGLICVQQTHLTKAHECFQASLRIAEQIGNQGDKVRIAAARYQLGVIAQANGCYQEAQEHYDITSTIAYEINDKRRQAASEHQRGSINHEEGNYKLAEEQYARALKYWQDIGNKPEESKTRYQIGMLYQDQGHYVEAEKHYQISLRIAQEIGDRAGEIWTLYQLGILYQVQRDYAKAQKYYQLCKPLTLNIGDKAMTARILHQQGFINQNLNNYSEAQRLYKKALAFRQEIGDKAGKAETLHQLGILYQFRKKYDEAIKCYKNSLIIGQEIGDNMGIATSLCQLGSVYWEENNLDDARRQFEEALNFWNDFPLEIARTHYRLGMISQQQHDSVLSQKHYTEALYILYQMGINYQEQDNLQEARQCYEDCLALADQINDQEWVKHLRSQLIKMSPALKDN